MIKIKKIIFAEKSATFSELNELMINESKILIKIFIKKS